MAFSSSGHGYAGRQPTDRGAAAAVSADLVIEDDIETELSMAGRFRAQQSVPPPPPSANQKRPQAGGRLRDPGILMAAKVSNRRETEAQLDLVQFPPVRGGRRRLSDSGSGRRHRALPPLTTPIAPPTPPQIPQDSRPNSRSVVHPELPPLTATIASDVAVQRAIGTTDDRASPVNSINNTLAAVQPPQLPAKLSFDRPWWKSVDREQQRQLLAAVPPRPTSQAPPPPLPTTEAQEAEPPVRLVGPPSAPPGRTLWTSQPITEMQIEALRLALFGNGDSRFSPDWSAQGFHFGFDLIPYLITSGKLETRMALNAVQCELVRQLLFVAGEQQSAEPAPHRLNRLARSVRSAGLARAICSIVSRCGTPVKITLPNPSGVSRIDNFSYVKDGISETLDVYTCLEGCDVAQFLLDNARCYESQRTPSLVLLLYSCLLTLGVDRPGYAPPPGQAWPLIGPDNLANQSLLALMLCGSPVGRVWNHVEADEAGVPARCDVGMLSQREFATRRSPEPYRLGSFLKSPRRPVWLLELEPRGRGCVAFSTDAKLVSDWRAERLFDLQLVSPELRARCPGRVLVDCRASLGESGEEAESDTESKAESAEAEDGAGEGGGDNCAADATGAEVADSTPEVSPVEMCIRTKWPGAVIQILQAISS